MEENDSGIIHTLYSSDFIYSDYHQPFRYQCKVRYYHGKWQLVYPLNWVERREIVNGKCNIKVTPGSYKFKKRQIIQELSDLLIAISTVKPSTSKCSFRTIEIYYIQ